MWEEPDVNEVQQNGRWVLWSLVILLGLFLVGFLLGEI